MIIKSLVSIVCLIVEVRLAVSSHVKYSLQAFWAVSIRELHMSLWRPWSEISDAASSEISSIVDSAHCQQLAINLRWGSPKLKCDLDYIVCVFSRNQEPHSENVIVIKSPKPPLVLGPPPRLAYPLVVFLIRETESDELSHPDDTVSIINIDKNIALIG